MYYEVLYHILSVESVLNLPPGWRLRVPASPCISCEHVPSVREQGMLSLDSHEGHSSCLYYY